VSLPGERIAWFAASELGNRRLDIERRVLRLVAERCSYQVPQILLVSDRGFDVRQMVAGRCDPWGERVVAGRRPSRRSATSQGGKDLLNGAHGRALRHSAKASE
jgi:hypothetical protein